MAEDKVTNAQAMADLSGATVTSSSGAGTEVNTSGANPTDAAGVDVTGVKAKPDEQAEDKPERMETPVPELPIDLKRDHPELYAAYVKHVQSGYASNDRVFSQVLNAFLRSHYSTLVMYWILFAVGVILFVVAVALALFQNQALAGAVFAGLSVVSFLLYFVSRPTQSVEENLIFIAWLGVVYNSYWTHLAWATERGTAQSQLDKATADVVQQLNALLDRHAQSVKERPSFKETIAG
jgi:hypothetical protein